MYKIVLLFGLLTLCFGCGDANPVGKQAVVPGSEREVKNAGEVGPLPVSSVPNAPVIGGQDLQGSGGGGVGMAAKERARAAAAQASETPLPTEGE